MSCPVSLSYPRPPIRPQNFHDDRHDPHLSTVSFPTSSLSLHLCPEKKCQNIQGRFRLRVLYAIPKNGPLWNRDTYSTIEAPSARSNDNPCPCEHGQRDSLQTKPLFRSQTYYTLPQSVSKAITCPSSSMFTQPLLCVLGTCTPGS